jgi:hypothetical protein
LPDTEAPLALERLQAGNLSPHLANFLIVFLLSSRHAKAQVEQIVVSLIYLLHDLLIGQRSQLLGVLVRHVS